MDYREKLNIYIPKRTSEQIEEDAILFEMFKKDNRTVNRNRFLSMLLCGYFDTYMEESRNAYTSILHSLGESRLTEKEKELLATHILRKVILPPDSGYKGERLVRISLKPTEATAPILDAIMGNLKGQDTISQFLCRMLLSYFRKPLAEREQIVFHEVYAFLTEACQKSRSIIFTQRRDTNQTHQVLPYAVTRSKEEISNYLICEEVDSDGNSLGVRSFKLSRITNPCYGYCYQSISPDVMKYCEKTRQKSPQYAINRDEEICVRMNDTGEFMYRRIYYGRPAYDRIEDRSDGHYYYFDCSPVQVFHYFRRFGGGAAEILYPEKLRRKILKFHESVIRRYEKTRKN